MPDEPPTEIATPDRRVRVFVSSTLEELAAERRAARAAIERLRLTPVMFELGARPHPPRELYRAYLAQSDVFVGIYGDRYGWVGPGSDISGLEDEYRLSGGRPRLMYIKTPAPGREPRLTDLIARIWADAGVSTTPYRDAGDLEERIADDLALLLTERFTRVSRRPPALHPEPVPVPPTPLVGREEELRTLVDLIHRPDVRLISVSGPGGIGKTRLALEAVACVAPQGLDGVCFVDLAGVTDPLQVPAAIATALGIRNVGSRPVRDALLDSLAGWRMLLVLDNFEHVLPAATDVARLLSGCPQLRILVTTRSVLHLRGENEFPVAPLRTPGTEESDTGTIGESPAVQLFLQRARAVRPDFELTPQNAAAVGRIVRTLDGIPLAVELAAARVRLMPPEQLLKRLGSRLDLASGVVDVPSRQRTLRATIEWSYGLLNEPDRLLFTRLSVLAGGWSMSAAEAVGAQADDAGRPDLDVLETLSSLVEHSMVAADAGPASGPRFRMLDTVREFAATQLGTGDAYHAAMRRLAAYALELSGAAGKRIATRDGPQWAARIDTEQDMLSSVVRWAIDADDAELAVRVTAPLSRYWWTRGLLGEMRQVADETAALPSASHLADDWAALLLWARGTTRIALGRTAEAAPLLEEAVAAARRATDDATLAHALFSLALTLPYEDQAARMRAMLEESAALFRRLEDHWGVALVLIPLGDISLREGDVATAGALHAESLELATGIDDDHMRAQSLDQLAFDALVSGDLAGARDRLFAAATLHRRLHDHEGLAYCLDGFAGVAMALDQGELAGRLLGTAARVREVAGIAVWPLMKPLADGFVDAVRTALGDTRFRAAREQGAATEPLAALDEAITATAGVGVSSAG